MREREEGQIRHALRNGARTLSFPQRALFSEWPSLFSRGRQSSAECERSSRLHVVMDPNYEAVYEIDECPFQEAGESPAHAEPIFHVL